MCGILGFSGKTEAINRIRFESLLYALKIRGRHSTGISFIDEDHFVDIIKKVDAKEFIKGNFDFKNQMIAHCRYSTSDINYGQPISSVSMTIAHNGVITQEPFEKWKTIFPLLKRSSELKTRNDSEILLKYLEDGFENLLLFSEESIAFVSLDLEGNLYFYRNGKRPLSYSIVDNSIFVSSTLDSFIRSKFKEEEVFDCAAGYLYVFSKKNGLEKIKINENLSDYQFPTDTESFYSSLL